MDKNQGELLDLLNGSGFPFQIGVRREIERTMPNHGWAVDAEEHYWHHPTAKSSGFIDLIISHQNYIFTILIECKRVKEDGKWLFLMPRDYAGDKRRISALCTNKKDRDAKAYLGWCDFDFDPVSPEASYCVFRTQDEKNPLLERIADALLPAAEAVGFEEMSLKSAGNLSSAEWRLFMPLIVTNATLFTGTFDADQVSMAGGRLAEGTCEFKPVPFVRFRKSLATHYPGTGIRYGHQSPLGRASLAKERTVLVIHAPALADSLKRLKTAETNDAAFGQRLFALNP